MSEEKKRFLSASKSSLPLCSEIPDTDTVKHVSKLMREGNALRARISEDDERLTEIKNELSAICEAYRLDKGFRHGMNGFEYHGYTSRKTFNKEKAATLIPADVIDQCFTEGTPYLSVKLIAFDVE